MTDRSHGTDDGPIWRGIAWVGRVWAVIVDGLAALGTAMIGVLMLIICSDVVARNLLGGSLPLVSELSALTLVSIVYLQLGATIRHDRLARTEIFFESLKRRRPRIGALLGATFDLVGAVACAGIAWSSLRILERDIDSHGYIGVVGVLTFPTWPFRTLILVGVTVAAVQFAVQIALALRIAARPPRIAS